MSNAVNIAQGGSNNVTMRNRIINGAQVIDQRNAGNPVTLTSSGPYVTDRWKCNNNTDGTATAQQVSDAPTGFNYSLKYTATATDTNLTTTQSTWVAQYIEGYNTADLGWGTANAKTITISFWVKSSLTGTFSYSISNNAFDRSYVTTYTINSANTWEYKTITIAGDTSGTWLTTNGIGMLQGWYLGVGPSLTTSTTNTWQGAGYQSASGSVAVISTSGATFYITGVQLEAGTTASPFEYRQYGTELQLCQRYFEVYVCAGNNTGIMAMSTGTTTSGRGVYPFKVQKRANPSSVTFAAANLYLYQGAGLNTAPSAISIAVSGPCAALIDVTISGATANATANLLENTSAGTNMILISAEL